jgi:hypothetical protein
MPGHFSDERQSNRENQGPRHGLLRDGVVNPPRPFGLRRKSGHTSLSALAVGSSTAFGLRLVWPDLRSQRCSP